MKKSVVIFAAVVLIIGGAFFFLKGVEYTPAVCFKGVCLAVEEARTPEDRARGLMFRKYLPKTRGMLFVFPNDDRWSFWMKNTYIPLDLVWLDHDRKVVDIVENARPGFGEAPPSFSPSLPARYVLEANAGFVAAYRIKTGDEARFRWIFSRRGI